MSDSKSSQILSFPDRQPGPANSQSFDDWLDERIDRRLPPSEQIEQARREIRAMFVRRARALGEI